MKVKDSSIHLYSYNLACILLCILEEVERIIMKMHNVHKVLVSILMESSLYLTLSLQERRALLARLAESYPSLAEGNDEDIEVGYESSWTGIF